MHGHGPLLDAAIHLRDYLLWRHGHRLPFHIKTPSITRTSDRPSAGDRVRYLTGWRIDSEVLTLEWRQVDFEGAEIRLEPGTTKNKQGRTFPFTNAMRTLLEKRRREHKKLKKAGHIIPNVFWRMVAEERGGVKKPRAIKRFNKEWTNAVKAAGCPGRIPHDLRRTAVRNLVRAGIPDSIAMKLTGHKTRSVFDRYDIASSTDFQDAARRLDEVATQRRASR